MSKALEAAANMIANFDRIKDDPDETLRAIFAHLAEDEEVVERVAASLPVVWPFEAPPFSPELAEAARNDLREAARRALRSLSGKE